MILCAYDIAHDKRRDRLFRLLKDAGEHVQYSVFLCDLSPNERIRLETAARELLNAAEDQLLLIDLGPPRHDWQEDLKAIGMPWTPPVRSHIF